LHDGVGQTLSGLAAGLAALESRSETPGSTFRQQLVDMKMYAMQSVEELHRVIADLRPSLLDDLGLVAALRWYARQYTETLRLAVSVEVQGHIGRLPPETEIVLFRIAQEALANVVRHARANHATVKLTLQGARVLLQIVDDGIGFDPQKAFAESGNARPWGLLGMQERAALVGGSVVIESQPWAGAKVTVEIPVPEHAPQGGRE
jgi:signal transduction histidine kinase